MPFAIGLRFYRISIRKKGNDTNLPIGPGAEPCDLVDYVGDFITRRKEPTVHAEEQRTWFFEPLKTSSIRAHHGYINYGTHGFESKLKDVSTRQEKYHRQSTDLEEIPLYFQFWMPSDSAFGLAAFQSFQGRSCISFVRSAMVRHFNERYPGYVMLFNSIAPSQSMMDDAPVKRVTFYKPKVSNDKADRYLLGRGADEVDYELSVRAKRRGSYLSNYKDLRSRFGGSPTGVVEFDGHQFESVKADIEFGGRRRTVGVYGPGYDPGLIDVSNEVTREDNGHPSLASIEKQVDELMEVFSDSMKT
jgi:hypothetical protein